MRWIFIIKNKKIFLLLLLTLVCILSISTISAAENNRINDVISADNNQENNLEINNQYYDVSNSQENVELKEEETNNDKVSESETDKTTTNNAQLTFKDFTDLNTTINGNENSTIYLSNNYYQYNGTSDKNFKEGILISRDLTIYGNGVTINGANIARIFKVENNVNVKFYNIIFRRGNADYGGAIYGGNAYNCTFTENRAKYGGAIYGGNAYNCTFTGNTATADGGAISKGNTYNCTFTKNTASYYGGAIDYGNATNCTFTENNANNGGAIDYGTATNCTFTKNTASYYGGAINMGYATNCTFTKNNAKYGGAIALSGAYLSTFIENTATDNGGAIDQGNAYYCTFTNNTATDNGGAIDQGDATNCTFTKNNAKYGGAIDHGTATNCTFTKNNATNNGGAINMGYAYNCEFIENNANCGVAMYGGSASLCIFNGDTIYNTNIIPAIINVINYTSPYGSGERLKFNLTADKIPFDGFNTTIKIYKYSSLVKTVYGLTGEGWIVDLDPGQYNAELSLTDYPEEKSSKATIIVSKINTRVVIDPIINPEVGKEIIINYTTNSNGTTTIKVNGETVKKGKFTPTKTGIYNVTVEVAENKYYTAATNQTTFIIKENTTILISPIIDYVVGETIPITFGTNSNGTATIKVNGEVIPDGNFTPTKAGTYNLTIEIAENDYYTAATNQTTFTVGKLASQIIASPVTTTYNLGKNLVLTLKDSNGKAIKGAVLTVNLGSSKKYTTDANGQIKINVTTLTPKTYNAKITYDGSDIYKGSAASVKVTVKKATPKITANAASYKLKVKTKIYTVSFKDNINKPLKNTKVTLKVNAKTYSVKTNSKGQGVFKITNLKKKGSYTAIITVPANTYYNKASKNVKITVKK